MIDLYYAPTPNGWKVAIMLEETGLDYRPKLMRLSEGDQFAPEFLTISPNAKIPAIVDHAPGTGWGAAPVTVFETAAVLLYLADKTGQFAPPASDLPARKALMEWLFWQVGNQGPMGGQLSHFRNYAPEGCPSSYKMGHQSGLNIGGSGSVARLIMLLVSDAASITRPLAAK